MMIKNKEFTCTLDLRVKHEDDRRGGNSQVGHDRKEEQGRSMVEMLGVLAVVGVLSVGGIAGYTYAMNKHYANELLMGASERAVLVTAQIASGRKPSLKEFANHTTAGGTFATDDESIRVYTDGIGIPVSGVKGAVCENLIKATDGTDILITDSEENEISAEDCAEESNDLLFVFETGIGGASDSGANETVCDPACEGGQRCIQGVCVYSITDCPIEICDEDEYCYLAEVCSEICSEEYNETTGEYSYVCNTDEEDPPRCNYNSDCDEWCQEQDGDCFCNITGNLKYGEASGSCALVDDVDFVNDLPHLTWYAGNNWCQAQGLIMASFTGEYDSFDTSKICDEKFSFSCSDRLWVTINGKPAQVDCCYDIEFDKHYGEFEIPCVDPKTWNN